MQTLDATQLQAVTGGETFGQVISAVRANPDVPVAQTAQQTVDFIAAHPFFHQGVMNLPIGGGKHFRNVPFVGPGRIIGGALHGNRAEIQRGVEVTRGTWAAR